MSEKKLKSDVSNKRKTTSSETVQNVFVMISDNNDGASTPEYSVLAYLIPKSKLTEEDYDSLIRSCGTTFYPGTDDLNKDQRRVYGLLDLEVDREEWVDGEAVESDDDSEDNSEDDSDESSSDEKPTKPAKERKRVADELMKAKGIIGKPLTFPFVLPKDVIVLQFSIEYNDAF